MDALPRLHHGFFGEATDREGLETIAVVRKLCYSNIQY